MMIVNRIVCCLALALISLVSFACSDGTNDTPRPFINPPAGENKQASGTAITPMPLSPSAYRAEWVSNQIPSEMSAGKEQKISVTIKNAGDGTWPSKGTAGGPVNQVVVSYHWLPSQGDKAVLWDGARTTLLRDIAPGETVTLNYVSVIPPREPGSYRLQVGLVHEGVTWFEGKGASTLTVPVTVR